MSLGNLTSVPGRDRVAVTVLIVWAIISLALGSVL